MLADEGQELLAIARIGLRQHAAVGGEPLDVVHRVDALTVRIPSGRISATEPVQDVLHDVERQVVRVNLDVQQRYVDVEKEVQIDVRDRQYDGFGTRVRYDTHRADVVAAEHPHRRGAVAVRIGEAIAIKKSLYVRKKRDEFVVVAFLILSRCAAEFVDHLAPRIVGARGMQHFPMPLHLVAFLERDQLQWPQQNLPEMAHAFRC